jgi:hypothetical protein
MFRLFVHLVLCVSIALSGTVYSAESGNVNSSSNNSNAKEQFLTDIESLREAILNQSSTKMDRYQLLRQDFVKPEGKILSKNTKLHFSSQNSELLGESLFRASESNFSANDIRNLSITHDGKLVHSINLETNSIAWNSRFIVWLSGNPKGQQQLNFIDLDFVRMGKSELPVFNFPIHGFGEGDLSFKGRNLMIGSHKINHKQLVDISKINQIAFSLSVNLLDVQYAENTKALIAEFHDMFLEQAKAAHKKRRKQQDSEKAHQANVEKMIQQIDASLKEESSSLIKELPILENLKGENRKQKLEEIKKHLATQAETGEVFLQKLEESEKFKNALEESSMARTSHLKLSARIHEFFLSMSVPRPDGAASLKKAMLHIASGVREGRAEEFREAFYHAYGKKKFRYSVLALGTVGMASLYPQEMALFFYQGLSVGQAFIEGVYQKSYEFVYLMKESVKATFAGFNPAVFADVYINDGRWQKTLTGLSALMGMMFLTLGMPHFIVNGVKLAKDLRNYDYTDLKREYPKKRQVFTRLKHAFIDRQQTEERAYIKLIQEAEAGNANLEDIKFTPEEEKQIEKLLKQVKEKDFGESRWFKWAKSLRKAKLENDEKHQVDSTEMNLRGALMHFLFSFSSFTNSGVVYATVWNYWFILRTLTFRPQLWPYLLMYPKFFKTAVLHKAGKVNIPTKWNGGLEHGVPFINSLWAKLRNKELHLKVQQLESNIVDFESQAMRLILPEAFRQSVAFSKSVKDFEKLTSENIQTYTDKHMRSLSFKTKVFFQWYVHIAMDHMVREQLERSSGLSFSEVSKSKFKKDFVKQQGAELLPMSDKQMLSLFEEVNAKIGLAKVAADKAETSRMSMKNQLMSNYQNTLYSMDPRYSGQFERFAVSEEQMSKPKAVARAVRASIVRMIIDKPMELAFLFVMVAGVSGGLVEPIHDAMFSENSWFYLSKYQFLKGFAYGLISGLLADVWMKLQQDARVDKKGGFDKVPEGELAKKSFWANLRHEMKANDNTWWQNQVYYAKLIWANMGAALVTMAAIQWVSLGRFDLDIYIAGYLLAYFSPLSGLGFMIENAFEKASSWVVRDIPEKYRNHPKVIKYSAGAMASLRVKFNIWYSIYENTVGHLLSNFQNMSTEMMGPRSFSRWIAGGYTFTEALINYTDGLAEKYPIMEKPANFCRSVFLNNYTAGAKLNKK